MNKELMVNNIKELCKNKNMTITGLEDILGFSQGLIGRWKDKSPSIDRIIDIADYFMVPIDDLIGRSTSINDAFIEAVYKMTKNGEFIWSNIGAKSYIVAPKMAELYDEDKYNELYYYCNLDAGFITIRCLSEHGKTLYPSALDLYIQPSVGADRVYQDYSTEQLLPLWVLILSKLDDVPVDVKVENMKQNLINPNLSTSRLYNYALKFNAWVDAVNKEE